MSIHPFHLPGSYLVLELTNRCNLHCSHCARSELNHTHYLEEGVFPRAGVAALIEDLKRVGARFDNLVLFWLGEPLCHPEFTAIYETLVLSPGIERVFGRVEVHTNATLLDRRVAAGVVNRHMLPQRWHISIDAVTPETYRRIKGVDALARVEANVARLLQFRTKGGFPWPRVVPQFIVSDRNEQEAGPFLAHWRSLFGQFGLSPTPFAYHVPAEHTGDAVFYRSLDCPTIEAQRRQDAVYARVVTNLGLGRQDGEPAHAGPAPDGREDGRAPCSGFWKSPVIGWDGRLTTCTRDNLFQNLLGNVLETPFSELWFGAGRIATWRKAVARGDYRALPICRRCFIPQSHNYTGITPDEIQRVEALSHA